MALKKEQTYNYDDHSSIPFKLVHLKPVEGIVSEVAHRHNFFQIFFFTQTGGKHLVDFEEKICCKNEVHVVNPGSVHKLSRDKNTNGYVFLFSRSFFDKNNPNPNYFLYRDDFNKFVQFPDNEFQEITKLISKIDKEYKHKEEHSDVLIRSILEMIIIFIQRKIPFENLTNSVNEGDLLNQFTNLVNQNFHAEHQLHFYLDQLHVTSDKLNEVIQSRINKTASILIQERTLLEAKRLLYYSSKSIKEIAFALGYDDPSYFNRFFKKKLGQTPQSFRKEIQEKYH